MSEDKQTSERELDMPEKKRKGSKKLAIVAVVVVVLVAVGAGMMVWHESPTFCSTLCHAGAECSRHRQVRQSR